MAKLENQNQTTKHTPAPWSFSPQDGKPRHCHMAQVWDNTGHNLATIEATDDENEATANARLISAAPDMLEVLQKLRGIEAWIGDRKMKEMFQRIVYPVIEKVQGGQL